MSLSGRPTLRRRLLLAFAGLALLSSAPLLAEDLDPASLFDSAKTAYGEKKYGKALQDLNLLVKELGRLRMESLKTTLPAAPAGWTAEDVEGDASAMGLAVFGGGISVKRTYRKGDETQVTVTLTADSPMVAGFAAMFQFAPQGQVVTVKGRRALLEVDKDDKSADLKLLLNGNTSLLQVEGRSVTREDVGTLFANALDLDGMEKALQN